MDSTFITVIIPDNIGASWLLKGGNGTMRKYSCHRLSDSSKKVPRVPWWLSFPLVLVEQSCLREDSVRGPGGSPAALPRHSQKTSRQ